MTRLTGTPISHLTSAQVSTAPFWYFIHQSVTTKTNNSPLAITLYVISPIIILLIATCGILGSFLYHDSLLQMFGMINITLFVFNSIQFIITWLTWRDCERGTKVIPNSPYKYICDINMKDLWYWIPTLITLFINVLSAFCGCFFSKKIAYAKNPPSDSY